MSARHKSTLAGHIPGEPKLSAPDVRRVSVRSLPPKGRSGEQQWRLTQSKKILHQDD